MIDIKSLSIVNLLPANLVKDKNIKAAAEALDKELLEVTKAIELCNIYNRIDELPEQVIDLLAWQFHVDFYEPSLPIEHKRMLVKDSYKTHKQKGTAGAVEQLITTLFNEGKVVEWFEYDGEPYKFKVVTNNSSVTTTQAEEFIRALDSVKNARSHLEKVEITMSENLNLYFAGIVHTADKIILRQVM